MKEPYILILFASKSGSTHHLARSLMRGVNSVAGMQARLRTVPTVEQIINKVEVPEGGAAFVSVDDLKGASGVALGSPTHFSNMSSGLQYFLEQTSTLWMQGSLVDKPLGVFTSSSSMHGGQETTLMNMITPFLHHGMIIVGLDYAGTSLGEAKTGGTPYGASHVELAAGKREIDEAEHKLAMEHGKRIARVAKKMIAVD